ncbi:hypothetical protein [Xanthobacter autotrophicus]|uniref:hypothetical protein n=1 Tax=Xanthobacter autotrophicus TaxID=280 RepID=UPI0037275976
MPSEMQERIAKAFDEAEVGYRMELTRLVDGEQTYTLYILGDTLEFPGTDEAYDHVRRVKNCVRALAVMKAMLEPTTDMEVAGTEAWLCEAAMEDRARANWIAMLSHEIAAAEEAR